MKKNLLLTICFMIIVPPGAYANNVQTLTINGQTVNKALSKMTFDGDNVILTFTDNSSQTSEMESVSLSFSSASAIDAVSVFQYNGIVGDVISLGGLTAGTSITIYDTAGRKQMNATAQGPSAQIDIASLQNGIYMLKAGKQVVKFAKR